MPIIHHPLTFKLGPLPLTGFGIAVCLAFVLANNIAERELERRGHSDYAKAIPDLIIASIVGTLVGGKLYYASLVSHNIGDLLGRAGFVFWGGFIGSLVANWLVLRHKKLSFVRVADVGGICIAAGYCVGRTGCWAVGDDYGRPWNGPLAVMFPEGSPPSTAQNMQQMFHIAPPPGVSTDTVLAVHPTQLYETALGFVMFLILWRYRDHKHAEGWLFGLYGVLAGIERFLIEFVRAKDDRFVGPFTLAQLIAIGITLGGLLIMQARRNVAPEKSGIYARG
jgi:phosphatidylglycerol:prolipoprotein diacylglycerol transferase